MLSHEATQVAAAAALSTPATTFFGVVRRHSPVSLIIGATAPSYAHNQHMLAHEQFERAACANRPFGDKPRDVADTVGAPVTAALREVPPVADVDSVPEVLH